MKEFNWGFVVERHKVGPYEIIEYDSYASNSKKPSGEILFHGYINGVDVNESWHSIDSALAGLIVRKNLGPNHREINNFFIAGIMALKQHIRS